MCQHDLTFTSSFAFASSACRLDIWALRAASSSRPAKPCAAAVLLRSRAADAASLSSARCCLKVARSCSARLCFARASSSRPSCPARGMKTQKTLTSHLTSVLYSRSVSSTSQGPDQCISPPEHQMYACSPRCGSCVCRRSSHTSHYAHVAPGIETIPAGLGPHSWPREHPAAGLPLQQLSLPRIAGRPGACSRHAAPLQPWRPACAEGCKTAVQNSLKAHCSGTVLAG